MRTQERFREAAAALDLTRRLGQASAQLRLVTAAGLIMVAAFTFTFYWLLLRRLQSEILEREGDARWIRELLAEGAR